MGERELIRKDFDIYTDTAHIRGLHIGVIESKLYTTGKDEMVLSKCLDLVQEGKEQLTILRNRVLNSRTLVCRLPDEVLAHVLVICVTQRDDYNWHRYTDLAQIPASCYRFYMVALDTSALVSRLTTENATGIFVLTYMTLSYSYSGLISDTILRMIRLRAWNI